MKYWLTNLGFLLMLLVLDSCIDPFSPPEVNSDESYLVVDGFFNVGNDTSRIELRRSQNVNDAQNPILEPGANVSVESEAGEKFNFQDAGNGLYILPPGQYDRQGKYRLRIQVREKEYLSSYVPVSVTPVIDSITTRFDTGQDAMYFNVNAHDPTNNTQFYRWKFEETWEYRAAYNSSLEVVNKQIVARSFDINQCWGSMSSGSILLGSTVKLTADVIKDLPLYRVPVSTNKLFIKYSILVRQYGLTREAFEYWTSLAKTTQGTGSLFDPQPSQVTGNILNTNDSHELVFGYFSAGTEETKRLTIRPGLGTYPRCAPPDTFDIVCSPMSSRQCALETTSLLISYGGERPPYITGAPPSCADCRAQGGSLKKPDFW